MVAGEEMASEAAKQSRFFMRVFTVRLKNVRASVPAPFEYTWAT